MDERPAREYLQARKRNGSPPPVVAFPMVYPREVLTALDVPVWERWTGPPGGWGAGDPGRLQGYICPIARGLQGVAANELDPGTVVIVPHTCDSLQGLGSLLLSHSDWGGPTVTFRLPRGTDRKAARRFLRREVERFIRAIEDAVSRKLDPRRLVDAIEKHRALDRALTRILSARPLIEASDRELYRDLDALRYLPPDEMLPRLSPWLERIQDERRPGIGVVVSGILPEPRGWFDALEDAGLYVAADDYALFGRRVTGFEGVEAGDPVGTLVERLMHLPPCPTRSADVERRIQWLVHLARRAGVRGVILHTVRSCEPELFDIPTVRRGLEQAGCKVLHVETEIESSVTGQMMTRLEAFAELLESLEDRP